MKEQNTRFHLIYGMMIAVFLLILLWAAVNDSGRPLVAEFSDGRTAFDSGWMTADGEAVDTSHLNDLSSVEPYRETSIYHRLPDSLEDGFSLCFRSKNIFYRVYVDGELRYAPEVPEGRVYNDSFGTRWNYVPVYSEDAGKNVEVCFYTVYESSSACLDHLYLGKATGEILHTFSEKAVSFVTCLLLLFAGFLLIVADIPINMQNRKNHELLYLGLFAVSIALWCLAETNLFQFFTNDSRFLQLVSCCSLIMIPIPMVLYLDAAFGFRRHVIVSFVCYLSAAEFAVCTILHFSGIADYHDTLTLTHVMLGISAGILLVTILRNAFVVKGGEKNGYKILKAVGLLGIGLAAVIDLARYYRGYVGDSAMFVRIGLLIFVLCYGSSSLEKTIQIVKLGVQTEFVSQLAYRDGLTGIGNRTAFQERMAELESEKNRLSGVGIMMFDVNDLKYVNDHLGHQAGDDMLVCSADLIKNVLEKEKGSCYRVGGDEFAAIVSGDNVPERCEESAIRFKEAVEEYNAVEGKPFRISVASGYAVYDKSQPDISLADIYHTADERMYENKKRIKAARLGVS